MRPAPVIDMFSGTGSLGRAVSAGLAEPTRAVSFSDNYGPARKYLKHHFPGAEVHEDFREQIVPEGSIVAIGAPRQDLSVAGAYAPPTGQTAQFMHWMMGLPYRGLDALGLSVSAQRRLAGNAVVGRQARLMLQRGLAAVNQERNSQ